MYCSNMVLRLPHTRSPLPGLAFEPLDLNRLPDIRALQIRAFRVAAARGYDDAEPKAFEGYIANATTADRLKAHDAELAVVGGQVVGTAGWAQASDDGGLARLTDLFVDPLFMKLGVGAALALRAEQRAQLAGYDRIAVRAPLLMAAYFERRNYAVTSYGSISLRPGLELSVAFLKKPLLHMGQHASARPCINLGAPGPSQISSFTRRSAAAPPAHAQ